MIKIKFFIKCVFLQKKVTATRMQINFGFKVTEIQFFCSRKSCYFGKPLSSAVYNLQIVAYKINLFAF